LVGIGLTQNKNKIGYMKNETFYQARKLNDQIDELSAYLNKLYHAKGGGKFKEVKITYHVGQYDTKCEVVLKNEASDFIEEMIKKEINRIIEERDKLQNEFDNL
jgi:hypothetical protein